MAAAGRHFTEPSADRVPILLKHRNPPVFIKCDDGACARMAYDNEINRDTIRQ